MIWLLACTSPDEVVESAPSLESPSDSLAESQPPDESEPPEECDTAYEPPAPVDPLDLCEFAEEDLVVLVADGFERDASWDLGTTEVGERPYVEVNEPGSAYVSLTGSAMSVHYFAGGDSVPDQWVNVGRTALADVVIEARVATLSEYYGRRFGLSYRMPEQDGVTRHAGYHVLLESGVLSLYAGQRLLASAELGDDHEFHAWRVVANGPAHCVWVDDDLAFATLDETWTRPGYIGVGAYYSIGYVDDLVVREHPARETDPLQGFDAFAESATAPASSFEWIGRASGGTLSTPTGAVELVGEGVDHDWRLLQTGVTRRLLRDGVEVSSEEASTWTTATVEFEGELDGGGLRGLEPEAVYPQGTAFPVLYYSAPEASLADPVHRGGTLVHTYGSDISGYADSAVAEPVRILGNVGTYYVDDEDPPPNSSEEQVQETLDRLAAGGNVGWWTYPEELRYWRENELAEMANLFDWTRASSPAPTFMYQANHYSAEALAESVPYVDIVGKGAYVGYAEQPRAWVRHQVESTVQAIELAGREVGPDWESGQRTPIVITGLWPEHPASAAELYHDVWSGIASGAQGIAVFSLFYGLDPASGDGIDGFDRAAGQLGGGIGRAVLFGTPVAIDVDVVSGAETTVEFTPYGLEPMSYPCVNAAGWTHQGQTYVVAVNSCEEASSARLSGLGADVDAEVLDEERVLCVDEGALEDEFSALGVHLYQLEAE